MIPTCHGCQSSHSVGIYDHNGERLPLCADCAPESARVVSPDDLPAVAASGICWCHLDSPLFRVRWCPHIATGTLSLHAALTIVSTIAKPRKSKP
jgi:hypothetical protein